MKNKFIIAIVSVVTIGIVVCMAYILNGMGKSMDNTKNSNESNESKVINNIKDDVNEKEESGNEEQKFEKIEPNSKIGLEVLSNFNISQINFFSDMLYDEIDSNGLSDKAKLIYTYLLAISSDKYTDKFEYIDELQTNCISEENIDNIAKIIFGNATALKHQDILSGNIYNKNRKIYQNIPMGFGGMNTEYSFDIPYEIKEYNDRVELICNRLYLTTNFITEESDEKENNLESEKLEENTGNNEGDINKNSSYISVFSNRNRSNLLLKIDDQEFIYSPNQGDLLFDYIKTNKINSDSLIKIKYILKKENNNYIITDIKK